MVMMDAFLAGDVHIDFLYESAEFRYKQATGQIFLQFFAQAEREIPSSTDLYHQAISAGTLITRDEYPRD
jgi:hypothetical protein